MRKILIVDANLFFAAKLADAVKRLGLEPESAFNADGLRAKIGPATAAVIVNLGARGLDGVAAVRDLKSSSETAAVPVIGFAGHAQQPVFQAALAAGCNLTAPNSAIAGDLGALLRKIKAL